MNSAGQLILHLLPLFLYPQHKSNRTSRFKKGGCMKFIKEALLIMCVCVFGLVYCECQYSALHIPVPTEVPCGCSPINLGCESYCTRNPQTWLGVCVCPYFYTAPVVTGNAYSESLGRMYTSDDKKEPVINPTTGDVFFSTNDNCPKCGHSAPIHWWPNAKPFTSK